MRGPVTAAATLEATALAVFLSVIYSVNLGFPVHGSGVAPPGDWAILRTRWKVGHAIGFVLFTVVFGLLLSAALRPAPVD